MQPLASDLALALDPVAFSRALGIEPDPWQAAVLCSASRRLVLNCARQTGKSTTAATLALHRAVYYPGSLILLVSPSLRQSAELFRKIGALLDGLPSRHPERSAAQPKDPGYPERMGVQARHGLAERRTQSNDHPERSAAKPKDAPPPRPLLAEDTRLSCVLANGSRIVSLPSSEATIRGFSGAALIIEDEASRVADDLYRAVRPMLATSAGRLILMSTPFGKRGHFWETWSAGGPDWERITVPAAACPRIDPAFLAEERAGLGHWWYAQEYDCQFIDAATSAFTWDMLQEAQKEPIESWNL